MWLTELCNTGTEILILAGGGVSFDQIVTRRTSSAEEGSAADQCEARH